MKIFVILHECKNINYLFLQQVNSSSVNTKKLLSAIFLRRHAAKNVVSYPICIGHMWTRKEYTTVALFYAVDVH